MFNLETAISTWKSALKHNRVFLPDDIEELERHVRDHVRSACADGLTEEEAYRRAQREIGDLAGLESEYQKVFWSKVLTRRGAINEFILELKMLGNYLKIALRNLARNKGYTSINLVGLAAGIACFVLIGLFVQDELSYDQHNEHADSIVRVLYGERQSVTPTAVGPVFQRQIPEVLEFTRLYPIGTYNPITVRNGTMAFEETGFFYADSSVFNVFTFEAIAGTFERALTRPNTIVISRSAALKYFGRLDPIGEILQVGSGTDFEITAVMNDLPATSHFQFDFMGSFVSSNWSNREIWNSSNFYTYLKLNDPESKDVVQTKINSIVAELKATSVGAASDRFFFTMQRLSDIRLKYEGRDVYVLMFSAIGLLILLVACANYVNLATARASRRAREVGIRKVSGAHRGYLMRQFFGESMLMVSLASLGAVAIIFLSLEPLNEMSGKAITLSYFDLKFWGTIIGLAVIIGGLAGSYPAIMLSSYQPAHVLKSASAKGTGRSGFRRVLVVFQFAVTVFLLAGTFVVRSQLAHMQEKELGFDKEQVVVLSLNDRSLRANYQSVKDVFESEPFVYRASAIHSIPGHQRSGYGMKTDESDLNSDSSEGAELVSGIPVDDSVVEVLGMTMIAGAGFADEPNYEPSDGNYRYMVNEQFLRLVNWQAEEAIGRRINLMSNRIGEIVGVYQDYHHQSLHSEIQPQALFIEPGQFSYLMIRLNPGDIPTALAGLEKVWKQVAPQKPFTFQFLDDEYDALYKADMQTGQVISVFSLLAIFIACLGLIGLASFSAERKTKEIGVRKVMGASIGQIYLLMTKELVVLVGIAFLIAAPTAWYFLNKWLENFSFRIDLSIWIFLISGLTAMLIALLTVSYQSIRASRMDPVESLRWE